MAKATAGMRGNRSRNPSTGRLRQKRRDTLIGTIEKKYYRDFGVRSDMRLGTLLKKQGLASLNDLLRED